MRFGIIGVGSLGSVYGGLLCEGGEDVSLYEVDEAIVRAVERDGLRVELPDGDRVVAETPITRDPAGIDPVDVAFVLTKAFDTEQAIRDAQPMIDRDTRVVTVQNGVTNLDTIAEHVPREQVLAGYTRAGANTISPGHVEYMGTNASHIGGDDRDCAERVAETLTTVGIPTQVADDPVPYIWKKQFRNVARKPLSALTELRNGPQAELDETRQVARELIKEAMAVATAKDIEILEDDPVASFLEPVSPTKYDKKSSILEDVENGRRTEVEHINGVVVEYGEQEGIDTTYNRMARNLVAAKEHSYLHPVAAEDPDAKPAE